jgi:hypothetical protein
MQHCRVLTSRGMTPSLISALTSLFVNRRSPLTKLPLRCVALKRRTTTGGKWCCIRSTRSPFWNYATTMQIPEDHILPAFLQHHADFRSPFLSTQPRLLLAPLFFEPPAAALPCKKSISRGEAFYTQWLLSKEQPKPVVWSFGFSVDLLPPVTQWNAFQ